MITGIAVVEFYAILVAIGHASPKDERLKNTWRAVPLFAAAMAAAFGYGWLFETLLTAK